MEVRQMKPAATRTLHWGVAALMVTAFATGHAAFDFSSGAPRLLHRTTYFLVHRAAGIAAAVMIAFWLMSRIRRTSQPTFDIRGKRLIGAYHMALAFVAFLIPLLPWLARAMGGRHDEVFSLLPTHNLVSKADSALVYVLFEWHKTLVNIFLAMLLLHVGGALAHSFIWRDGVMSSMLWRRASARRSDEHGSQG